MQSTDDRALLRAFAENQSDDAFAVLVARYVNLVYSVALRHIGNPHHAEEITQAVFIILAKKAAQLRHDRALAHWLFQTTRLTAANFARSEARRHRREQEAYMQSTADESTPDVWPHIAPLLDGAVAGLREKERQAIVLRFYEGRNLREIGLTLGTSEAAAEKRVSRALEKLRRSFALRGVALSSVAIAGAMALNSVQAAPAALGSAITAVAVTKGATASASTLTLIKGALKMMIWTKAKTVIVATTVILFAAGTTVVVEKMRPRVVDESFWETKMENLDKAPPVLIIRPTRYRDYSEVCLTYDGRSFVKNISHNSDFAHLQSIAYSWSRQRMMLPIGIPTNHFDLMLTLTSHQSEALQKAIQKEFGFSARVETRETDVLALKVKDPQLLAMHQSKAGTQAKYDEGKGFWLNSRCQLSELARHLEYTFDLPVIPQPEVSEVYDFVFQWDPSQTEKQALPDKLAQFGLELVPSRDPIEMLVVRKK